MKGKWRVFTHTVDGELQYVVARKLDESKPPYGDNVEIHGDDMDTLEGAQKVADELNEKEKEMNDKDLKSQIRENQKELGIIWKRFKIVCAVLFILYFIFSGFTIIDTGERGVVLRFGEYKHVMNEGINFKMPFIDRVIILSVRDTTHNSKLEVSSKDMQTIEVESTLIYTLNPEKLGNIYKSYGMKYEDTVIKPTLAEVTNAVIAAYPIEEFVEKRAEISQKISDSFVMKTQDTGIVVKSLLITNHDFSDEYNKAIEAKKVAEQGALKAKYDLEKTRLDAEAQTLKQKSLNQMVLQEKAIDKWDGKLPQYYGGNGQLPFIMK